MYYEQELVISPLAWPCSAQTRQTGKVLAETGATFRMVSKREARGPKKPPFLLAFSAVSETGAEAAASAKLYNKFVALCPICSNCDGPALQKAILVYCSHTNASTLFRNSLAGSDQESGQCQFHVSQLRGSPARDR